MSDPVKLKITKAGLEAALNAEVNGISVNLDVVKFSTERFASVVNDPRTTLDGVVHTATIVAGGKSLTQNTLRFVSVIDSATDYSIGSIGVYTKEGVLFAVASAETGELMRILPRISFIMSFGMTLAASLLNNIQVVIDTNTDKAAALLFQHENHDDPHPQYKAQINQVKEDLNELDRDVSAMFNELNAQYPKHIMAGVAAGSATIDISAKIADMRDNRYTILLTPEGVHEGWSINRNQKNFSFDVFNRSGQDRVPYAGQVNWAVVQNSATYQVGGNGEYMIAGTYHIQVLPNETKRITLIGGGGGGGGSRYSGGSNYEASDGRAGQNTSISLNASVLASASGGRGGTVGVWGNGSSYGNGQAGLGGGSEYHLGNEGDRVMTWGANGKATREDHTGGVISPKGGSGGNGRNGVGDVGWSFGGGGGSGGMVEFSYKNTTDKLVVLVLVVGEGGLFEVVGQATGENGKTGYAKIETLA